MRSYAQYTPRCEDAVWNADHEDRVHWYVPADLENNAKTTETPEEIRDAKFPQHLP